MNFKLRKAYIILEDKGFMMIFVYVSANITKVFGISGNRSET